MKPLAIPLARLAAGPLIAILILWGDNEFYLATTPVTMWAYSAALVLFLAAAAFEVLDPGEANQAADLGGALNRVAGLALTVCTLLALCKTSLAFDTAIAAVLIIGRDLAMIGLREGLTLSGRRLPVVEGAKLQTIAVLGGAGCALAAQTLIYFNLPVEALLGLVWVARGALWAGAAVALITGALYARQAFATPASLVEAAERDKIHHENQRDEAHDDAGGGG